MIPFASSPQGEEVCERRVKSPDEARGLLIGDVGTILKQGINPGQIIVLLNEPKRESCLANVRAFGKIKFESLGRYYDNCSKSVRFTTINVFKGMEADVVFLFFDSKMNSENLPKLFYVQASRARLLLYLYMYE